MRRVDWLFLGGWTLIAFYVLGFWILAAFSFHLLSRTL
jgi:hypothetical protein